MMEYQKATRLVHGGSLRSQFDEMSEAIFMSQSYIYDSAEAAESRFAGNDSGFIYSRVSNPTTQMFEQRMALLEDAEAARATSTGMAAVTAALMGQLCCGDHIIAAKALFGACRSIIEAMLPKYGIEVTFVDGEDLQQWHAAVQNNTKVFFLESPTNPNLTIYDISAIAKIAHQAGAKLVVDNALASSIVQNPLKLGADCVVYSATKHIDGQGRAMGGLILASQSFIDTYIHDFLRLTGPTLSPFNAWLMLKSLETLPLRVNAQQSSAAKVADYLSGQENVIRVTYPGRPDHPQYALARKQMKGGGTIVTFEVANGRSGAFNFTNALSLIKISNNFGDAKSILTNPAVTTHGRLSAETRKEMGIPDGLLRLSIGLEHVEDLIMDIGQALEKV